uniref:MFS domain-containing protein n=2 Tax=Caenorhabditis japonica TaxID=281687 RepID=A0A8R1DNQ7_CAEJA
MADAVFPTQATAQTRYISLFGTRTRFVIMVLILLCLTSIWSNILAFNFAVVCMDDDTSEVGLNSTTPKTHFTSTQNSLAMSIVAIAALLGNFPIVQLVGMVGIRTVFAGMGILSAVATLLIPLSIRMGFYYFLAVRFLQGFAFAANFPVIGSFCAKWSYFKQNGLFVSSLVAYVQLSPAITMPASGALCSAFKWPSIFYAHGAVSLVLFVTYALFYRNSPQKHPFVGNVELKKISIGKIATVDKRALKKVPYSAILKTPAIWAVWIAAIGNFTCVNMMFLFSPIYLSKVLGFPVHSTGITAAVPPFLQFLSKLICGAISDRLKCIPEGIKFRIFNSIAFIGSAIFLAILAFMDVSHKDYNMIVLGCAAAMLGATTGGFFKAGPVLSKQYSHFVTGNISLGITITMLIVPFFVNALTKNNTQEEWKWVFLITGAVMVVTNIIFCIFVKGEPCEWTSDNFHRASSVADFESNNVRNAANTISTVSANLEDVPEKL